MSRKAKPAVIGAFTLGALALIVASIVIFGSGQIFANRPRAVVYFEGNIQGLTVGAPVTLRGVQVGTVSDIRLRLNVTTMEPIIPVYLAFDPERFRTGGLPSKGTANPLVQRPLRTAIAKGLHARLATQSFVTGQLLIELDLDPDEPRNFVGADPDTIEIPTSVGDVEKLKTKILQLPIDQIADTTLRLLNSIDSLVSSPEIPKILHLLVGATADADELIATTQRQLDTITKEFSETALTARTTLLTAQATLAEIGGVAVNVNQFVSADARDLTGQISTSLKNVNRLIEETNSLVASNSPQRYDLDQALKNLADASRSLRVFSDELQRRPNSLIVGK